MRTWPVKLSSSIHQTGLWYPAPSSPAWSPDQPEYAAPWTLQSPHLLHAALHRPGRTNRHLRCEAQTSQNTSCQGLCTYCTQRFTDPAEQTIISGVNPRPAWTCHGLCRVCTYSTQLFTDLAEQTIISGVNPRPACTCHGLCRASQIQWSKPELTACVNSSLPYQTGWTDTSHTAGSPSRKTMMMMMKITWLQEN